MFEVIHALPSQFQRVMSGLNPMAPDRVAELRAEFPGCPDAYWEFLSEVGFGPMREPDEPANYPPHFDYVERLVSARQEYYRDDRIFEGGASGDVLFFGFDSTGAGFGFDTGDHYRLVEVDNYRIVTTLDLGFRDFAIGMLACYPQFPVSYSDGVWRDTSGQEYSVPI